jgi:hypothetical protein
VPRVCEYSLCTIAFQTADSSTGGRKLYGLVEILRDEWSSSVIRVGQIDQRMDDNRLDTTLVPYHICTVVCCHCDDCKIIEAQVHYAYNETEAVSTE